MGTMQDLRDDYRRAISVIDAQHAAAREANETKRMERVEALENATALRALAEGRDAEQLRQELNIAREAEALAILGRAVLARRDADTGTTFQEENT